MDRRQFLKVTAATGASATLAGCGSPELHLSRFIPEEQRIPGVALYKPSICPLCSAGCGLTVRVMEGEAEVVRKGKTGMLNMYLAKKLEGNPDHPISQGRLCVRGQAAIQITYHPDRITTPLKRTGERGFGQFKEITWEEAIADLKGRLDGLASAGDQKSLTFLTRPLSGQRQALVSQFVARFGAPAPMEFEVFGEHVLRQANGRSFGHEQLPTFDLAHSRYVISFGADFLGTWNSPVSHSVAYGEMRQGQSGQRGKFVQVEPRMSQTGANADAWVPVKPGTEGVLALGMAHVIIKAGLRQASAAGHAGSLIDGWSTGLPAYDPDQVAKITGLSAARVEKLATEFAQQSPAVAIIGGAPLAYSNAMFHALAVNALNALVGSVGVPGGMNFAPRANLSAGANSAAGVQQRFSVEKLAATKLLLLNDTNPVFGTPSVWKVKETLAKILGIVSFGHFVDETSIHADLILPDHSFLESWVDQTPEVGSMMAVASVAPPAMMPIHQTKAMPDVLLEVAGTLAKPLTPALPWKTYDEMLKAAFSSTAPKDADVAWKAAQKKGGWWEAPAPGKTASTPAASQKAAAPAVFAEAQFDGAAAQYPFYFLPYASQSFLDGSLAHLPWLQELPDVMTTAMWSSWVEINPQTAAKLGIAAGDMVEVASSQGSLRSPAVVSPGIAPDVIGMPVGQGHQTFTRYASGRGANPLSILAPVNEPETGTLAWASTRVRISKVSEDGGLILFAGGMREHDGEHR